MASLVLSSDTITARLVSQHVEVIRWKERGKKAESRLRVPLIDIDRVLIIGRPSVSFPFFQRLLLRGIPCYLLTARGRWLGCLSPDNHKNAERRVLQYDLARKPQFSLDVAKSLVVAKVRNCRRVLQRLSANRNESQLREQRRISFELKSIGHKAENCENLDELRGFEGLAAARYFQRLRTFFPQNVPFGGRNRRPPKDAANALLSWTYSVLLGEIDAAVRARGLDAGVGFLHGIKYGSPSLSLDLLEPFRAPIADLLVLNLLNHKILTEQDFQYYPARGGFLLKPESHKTFFVQYESTMTRLFSPKKGAEHTTFRRSIDKQVFTLIQEMGGEGELECFLMP